MQRGVSPGRCRWRSSLRWSQSPLPSDPSVISGPQVSRGLIKEATLVHVLVIPMGSAGDVYPFVAMATALRQRGHRVTLLTSGAYQWLAEAEGLDFVPLISASEHEELVANPLLWHPRHGAEFFCRSIVLPGVRKVYDLVAERNEPGQTVMLAPPWAMGARIAQEKMQVPLATMHIAPLLFRSAYQNRRMPMFPVPDWVPPFIKRAIFRIGDWVMDAKFGGEILQFRDELGLPRVSKIMTEWWNSTQLIVGLFPEWFARPQPDWPPQTRLVGFPFYRPPRTNADATRISIELREFLAQGDRPLVFACGTANAHQEDYYRTAVEVCQRLHRRGILLTQYPQQLPRELPATIRHFSYVDFDELLPHAAGLVHHGGIGTCAQALAAGIPQLVRPLNYDQPDNGMRLKRLGVGEVISPARFTTRRVARALDALLTSADVQGNVRVCKERFTDEAPTEQVCLLLEKLVSPNPQPVP